MNNESAAQISQTHNDDDCSCDLKSLDKRSRGYNLLTQELITNWTNEQIEYRQNLQLFDTEPWQLDRAIYDSESCLDEETVVLSNRQLRYVAGLDISYVKDENTACSGLFVFDLSNNMKLVYKDIDQDLVTMEQPYVPGFLAYREAPLLLSKLKKLKSEKPYLYPQCLFIDGNGVLHVNKFGLACHLGMLSDTPAIGVSKKLFQVWGLENDAEHKKKIKELLNAAGDYFELRSNESKPDLLGYCYRSTSTSTNPIYVSIGNKISWSTCLWLLKLVTTKHRIPEPIRQADILTRESLRLRNIRFTESEKDGDE
jgi:endonuclease V